MAWELIGSYKDAAGYSSLTRDLCVVAIVDDSNSEPEHEILELRDLNDNLNVKWCKKYPFRSLNIQGEHLGKIYGKIGKDTIFFISSDLHEELFKKGFTGGEFCGDNLFIGLSSLERCIAAIDLLADDEKWRFYLPEEKTIVRIAPSSGGLIGLLDKNTDQLEAISSDDAKTIFRCGFPAVYDRVIPSITTSKNCLFLFSCKDKDRSTRFDIHYHRKLLIVSRFNGGIAAEYDNVPGMSGLYLLESTGDVFTSGGAFLYHLYGNDSYDPKVLDVTAELGDPSLVVKGIVGELNNKLVLSLESVDHAKPDSVAFALYDTATGTFSDLQYINRAFSKKISFVAKRGFLFLYLLDRTMHVFKWTEK